MTEYQLIIHSPTLNITEELKGPDDAPIVLEGASEPTILAHLVAQYNFIKYKGVSDWQGNVTVKS